MSTGLSSWSSRNPKEEPLSPPALAPTSIPDLISEEAGHDLEDGDADVIRLAQHRPYMQHLQSSVGELHVSSNYTTTSTSFETFSATTLERPAGRRMIMAGVVIPSRKRPSSERSLEDMDVEPSPSSASAIRNISTQTASVPAHSTSARKTRKLRKAFTEHQKDAMERAFSKNQQPTQEFRAQLATDIGEAVERVSAWFANRRKKEKDRRTFINDEGSGGSGSGHSSPSTSPVPSPTLPPVQEMPEVAESEDESSSEREDTPSADGVLGSASVRYRHLSLNVMRPVTSRRTTGRENDKSTGSGRSGPSPFLKRLAAHLRGYSIANAEDIPDVVDIMSEARNLSDKKHILNAILSTKTHQILRRFMASSGPDKIRVWIIESRKESGNAEHEGMLLKMICILKGLPYDRQHLPEHKIRESVRQLALDKSSSQELTKNATDLVNYWSKLTGEAPLGSMRSTPAEQSENARKKARLEDRSLPSREDRAPLPSFTKAKSAPKEAPKSQSRIRVNVDFFKELGQQSTSTSTTHSRDAPPNRDNRPARTMPSPTSTSPGNSNSNTAGANVVSPRISAPSSAAPVIPFPIRTSAPVPTAPVPVSRPTPIMPVPLTKNTEFSALPPQHTKSWEATTRPREEQQVKRKTVRFKNDDELVQVRLIERYQVELEEDEDDEDDEENEDMSVDYSSNGDEAESRSYSPYSPYSQHSQHFQHPQYSPFPPVSSLIPPPALGSRTDTSRMMPYQPPRPAFIMPEEASLDLMAGMYWRPPRPLKVITEQNSNNNDDQSTNGDAVSPTAAGQESMEKHVQAKREQETLAVVYKSVADIPPSPAEPSEGPQEETVPSRPIELFHGNDYSSAFINTMVIVCCFLTNKTPEPFRR